MIPSPMNSRMLARTEQGERYFRFLMLQIKMTGTRRMAM